MEDQIGHTAKQSLPISIPFTVKKRESLTERRGEEIELSISDDGNDCIPQDRDDFEFESGSSSTSDDYPATLPTGSPSFTTVLSELSVDLKQSSIDHRIPISPLALSDSHPSFDPFNFEKNTPEKSAPQIQSKQTSSKEHAFGFVASSPQTAYSKSWDYRNKMAAERRKQMNLALSHHLESSSTNSSPLILRKKRITKRLPGTFKTIQTHPKFKILTKNISVSHEDLVKEQEQEQKFKKNDVESIFKAPKFDRLGATPEK